jgi:hypothetical protein
LSDRRGGNGEIAVDGLVRGPDAPGSGLKILITNVVLNGYTGTEVVVRDLALELKRQGHSPSVFSKKLGPISHEISDQGIEVVSDLTALSVVPDIIHGHHHPPLVEALLQFPTVPAVWVCHDASSRFDEPFYSPRILRYVAVDNRCRKRVESSPVIPSSKIDVIWNAVDLERFQPRGPLPSKPTRALVFSRTAQLPAIRRAARRMGLKLDTLGLGEGGVVRNPESKLPAYDIVFAKARCALEAMAVGNAVVLCDFAGVGPMVSSENFDRLRWMNFGLGVLVNPLQAAHLEQEIERYDPADAARVCQRVRGQAGLPAAARRWLELYTAVRAEFREMHLEPGSELRSLAPYFRKWNYESRVDWELEQLRKLEAMPLLGKRLFRLAKRTLRWWKDT